MTQQAPRDRVLSLFAQEFGGHPAHVVRAPGRVNVIGEHTDYNDGFVLPAAIDREVWIALEPTGGDAIDVESESADEPARVALSGEEPKAEGWARYVQGVAWALGEADRPLAGWRGALVSDVPVGAGLSSSAALELAIARACSVVAGWDWDAVAIAKVCQRAENAWVGVNSGIMDQLASAAGVDGYALLLDCRSLDVEPQPLPDGMTLVVMDTSTRRELSGSGYNDRRRECEAAAEALGVSMLRDATEALLDSGDLDDLLLRRARHVVTENARTQAAADAMRAGDPVRLGDLMSASHRSMRDDFEISGEALDTIVEIASSLDGCYGARLTGGGFAGCAVALVATDAVKGFCEELEGRYADATEHTAQTHVCHPVDGASVESVD